MLSIYCFISCPPLVGHINQTAMSDILLCALIYPTATFISHSSCGEIELGWCPPSWHLSTAPRWPSRWSSVISWLRYMRLCLCDVYLVCILLPIPMLILYLNSPMLYCALSLWMSIYSCALLICSYSSILICFICWCGHILIYSYALIICWMLPWNAHMLVCSYARMLICSYAHMLICSYARMLIC